MKLHVYEESQGKWRFSILPDGEKEPSDYNRCITWFSTNVYQSAELAREAGIRSAEEAKFVLEDEQPTRGPDIDLWSSSLGTLLC